VLKVIDSASVLNAVGACGLELHRYGEAITIPFFTETCKRDHFYQTIVNNRWLGLHTLCLLDIYAKEPISESLIRGNKVYEPPRFMTVNTAISQLLEVLELRGEPGRFSKTVSSFIHHWSHCLVCSFFYRAGI